jgi:phage terminase large subunit-like protein
LRGLVEFARASLGLKLFPGQTDVLTEWANSGKRRILLCLGRRSGKGLMAAVAAIYNATMVDYSGTLRSTIEDRFIVVVANRDKQAQEFIRVVRELLEAAPDDDLRQLVDFESCTLEQIVFRNHVVIRAVPCSSRSTRGLPVSLLILDESGHFQTDSDGVGAGKEVYQALAPSIAQFGDRGYIMFTSTPKWRAGLFWEQYRNGVEGIDPGLLVIKRATWEMNPKITREALEPEFRVNPDYATTEYGADFSAAEGAFLDILDILAAKRETGTLAPNPDIRYKCAIDPAFQKDAFAMAIAHKELQRVVIDGVWTWIRQGYDNTLDQVAQIAKRYGIRQVRTDQFSSQSVLEGLTKRKIECEVIPWANENKFEAFTRLKAGLATRQVTFPNDDLIVQELMNLEAKPTVTGLVRISASAGNHDDRATVIAALMDMLESDYGPIILSWRDWRSDDTFADPYAQIGSNPFESWPMELD